MILLSINSLVYLQCDNYRTTKPFTGQVTGSNFRVVRLSQVSSSYPVKGFLFEMKKIFYNESDLIFAEHPSIHNFIDLTGHKYGRLSVLGYGGRIDGNCKSSWFCKCDCGNVIRTETSNLRNGHTSSCGCLFVESVTINKQKHGHALERNQSVTYHTWSSMKRRCYNKNAKNYERYGGRGIKVCERWINSFENFLKDMGEKPKKMTLERRDSNGDYCPENCKWADNMEQANNKRNNRVLHLNGESMTIAQWSRRCGIPYKILSQRINRGWGVERAITAPFPTR